MHNILLTWIHDLSVTRLDQVNNLSFATAERLEVSFTSRETKQTFCGTTQL